MKALVTGGAGFIGRWVSAFLLDRNVNVVVVDNLFSGKEENIKELYERDGFEFIKGDIRDLSLLQKLFQRGIDIIFHLAAQINVQHSIDNPSETFDSDVVGTFKLLEMAREYNVKFVFVSSCMVYDRSFDESGISEGHPLKPASPYAASKLAGEYLTLSYYYTYKLPVVVLRPFNTYGPFQRSDGEGGVVAVFIRNFLEGKELIVYGDGTQTRDLMFVEDAAEFIIRAGFSKEAEGMVINAGTGRDIPIRELAMMICNDISRIRYVPHIHPQSEIWKLLCNFRRAQELLGWCPKTTLEEGIRRTMEWMKHEL